MAVVKMKRGDKFADINDSEECIKQAQREGWSIAEEPKEEEKGEESADEKPEEEEPSRVRKNPRKNK